MSPEKHRLYSHMVSVNFCLFATEQPTYPPCWHLCTETFPENVRNTSGMQWSVKWFRFEPSCLKPISMTDKLKELPCCSASSAPPQSAFHLSPSPDYKTAWCVVVGVPHIPFNFTIHLYITSLTFAISSAKSTLPIIILNLSTQYKIKVSKKLCQSREYKSIQQ